MGKIGTRRIVSRKRKAVKLSLYGLLFFALNLLSGCGLLPSTPSPLTGLDAPRRVELSSVPFFSQGDDLCGPASLSMVLNYGGQSLAPDILEPQIYIPGKQGALQVEMLAATRRYEFVPYVIEPRLASLVSEIAAGNPVLVLQNLGLSWLPKWHYAVVIGYDLDRDVIVLRSGERERLEMAGKLFMRHWRGSRYWAMLALPAQRLPATAKELSYLESVASLERLEKWGAAARAYQAAIKRWPESFFAHLGAGTASYHLSDLPGAASFYQSAITLKPDAAVAHNNLAQVLYELGKYKDARAHAQKAVELGGPTVKLYRDTLNAIESVRNR